MKPIITAVAAVHRQVVLAVSEKQFKEWDSRAQKDWIRKHPGSKFNIEQGNKILHKKGLKAYRDYAGPMTHRQHEMLAEHHYNMRNERQEAADGHDFAVGNKHISKDRQKELLADRKGHQRKANLHDKAQVAHNKAAEGLYDKAFEKASRAATQQEEARTGKRPPVKSKKLKPKHKGPDLHQHALHFLQHGELPGA